MFGRSKTCIVCNGKLPDRVSYTHYEIKHINGKKIGELDIHKNTSCHNDGSDILVQQVTHDRTIKQIVASTTSYGLKHEYYMLFREDNVFDFFTHLIMPGGSRNVHRGSHKFLKNYAYDDHLFFAYTQKTLRSNQLPMLLGADDPLVPSDYVSSAEYQKRLTDAKKALDLNMRIRGKDEFEATFIFVQYAKSTGILLDTQGTARSENGKATHPPSRGLHAGQPAKVQRQAPQYMRIPNSAVVMFDSNIWLDVLSLIIVDGSLPEKDVEKVKQVGFFISYNINRIYMSEAVLSEVKNQLDSGKIGARFGRHASDAEREFEDIKNRLKDSDCQKYKRHEFGDSNYETFKEYKKHLVYATEHLRRGEEDGWIRRKQDSVKGLGRSDALERLREKIKTDCDVVAKAMQVSDAMQVPAVLVSKDYDVHVILKNPAEQKAANLKVIGLDAFCGGI